MDLLISVLVYGLTGLSLFVLAENMSRADSKSIRLYGKHTTMWSTPFVLSIVFFAIVAGLRYNTGVDHLNYLNHYIQGGDDTDEVLFYFITKTLSSWDVHFFFYYALWAAIQITFLYLAMRDRRALLPYIAMAIMLGPYFLSWMNGIRQTMVECFFVYVVSSFTKDKTIKKFIISVILLVAASTIHRSALILPALLCLTFIKMPLDKNWINIGIVLICVVVGMTPYWTKMNSGNITELLALMGYDHYSMIYENMVEMADFKDTAMGPLRLSSLCVDLIIIWYYPRMQNYYKSDNTLYAFFLFFLLGVFAYNLFANTNILFLRPIEYLTLFKLPMIGYTLYYLKKTKSKMFYLIAFLVYTYALIEVLKSGLLGTKETNLYHFFFLQ